MAVLTPEELNAKLQHAADLWRALDNTRLDQKLAERNEDRAAMDAAAVATREALSVWAEAHKDAADSAKETMRAMGFNIEALRHALT